MNVDECHENIEYFKYHKILIYRTELKYFMK